MGQCVGGVGVGVSAGDLKKLVAKDETLPEKTLLKITYVRKKMRGRFLLLFVIVVSGFVVLLLLLLLLLLVVCVYVCVRACVCVCV